MNIIRQNNPAAAGSLQNRPMLYWASLFTGTPGILNGSMEQAGEQLTEWWKYSAERITRQIPELPEDFRTTRIWRQIKYVDNYFLRLKPLFTGMQAGTYNLKEMMERLRRVFSGDETRLKQWKQALDNLQGLILWLPAFSHAREYLFAAFPLGIQNIDTLHHSLIQSIQDSYRFFETGSRERFDEGFLEFKKTYIKNYSSRHEAMRNVIRDVKKEESKVDPVALRNLELLSGLKYTDKSYFNQVNILAQWIRRNQCTLPVNRILERYPRCYCNFNPCSIRQPSGPVNRINGIISEGMEYFRSALRNCRKIIDKGIETHKLDESIAGQINALTGNGLIPPLKEQTIEALNHIIRENPNYFNTRIRIRTVQNMPEKPEAPSKS